MTKHIALHSPTATYTKSVGPAGAFTTRGSVCMGSNGLSYLANSDEAKGSAVDLSADPVAGDGSTSADWLEVASVTLDTELDQSKVGTALTNKAVSVAINAAYEPVENGGDIAAAVAKVVARAGSGKVALSPGNYENTGEFTIPDGVEIVAEKKESALIKQLDSTFSMFKASGSTKTTGIRGIILDGDSKVTNSGMQFAGNCQYPIAEDCEFLNIPILAGNGILIDTGYMPIFRRNKFKNVSQPIQIWVGTEHGEISDNEMFDWYQRGIYVSSYSAPATTSTPTKGLLVRGNVIHEPSLSAAGPSYVRQPIAFAIASDATTYHENIKIIGNKAYGPNQAYHAHITDDTTTDANGFTRLTTTATADQISISGVDGFTIADNESYGGGDMGYTVEQSKNGTVERNHAEDCSSCGYFVGADPNPSLAAVSENVKFINNRAINNRRDRWNTSGGGTGTDDKLSVNFQCYHAKNIIYKDNTSEGTEWDITVEECDGFLEENPDFKGTLGRIYGGGIKQTPSTIETIMSGQAAISTGDAIGYEMQDDLVFNELYSSGSPVGLSLQEIPVTGHHVVEVPVAAMMDKVVWFGLSDDAAPAYGAMSHMVQSIGSGPTVTGPILNGVLDGVYSEKGSQFQTITADSVMHWHVDDGVVTLWHNWVLLHTYTKVATTPLRFLAWASSTWSAGFGAEIQRVRINNEPIRWNTDPNVEVRWSHKAPYKIKGQQVVDASNAVSFIASKLDIGRLTLVGVDIEVGRADTGIVGYSAEYVNTSGAAINVVAATGATIVGMTSIPVNTRVSVQLLPSGDFLVTQ